MRAFTLAAALAITTACSHDATPAKDQPPKDQAATCEDTRAALVSFFTTAADEQSVPPNPGLHRAEMEALVEGHSLVLVDGKPTDISKSDYLIVGPSSDPSSADQLVSVDGTAHRLGVEDGLGSDKTHSLVIAVSPKTPWRYVKAVHVALRRALPEERYTDVSFAYAVDGVFAGRKPPVVDGLKPGAVDIPALGNNIAKDAAINCPEVAATLGTLNREGRFDADLLRTIARDLPKCKCTTSFALLEAIPWLVKRPLITAVPLTAASDQPPLPVAADDATFEDVVHANGGKPLTIGPPPEPPPPPPPPPRPKPRH